tara:strand:+ start:23714 stop:24943 length:1230 start_codon:yes stop_codon:yes gene_type:complete
MITVFENARVFDGIEESLIENIDVIVEGEVIKGIGAVSLSGKDITRIDCRNKVLMPGLIDAHVHAYTPTLDFNANDNMPAALMANHAAAILEGMLDRGFTSVRDAAGGDRGLFLAIEKGLIKGPRFFYPGKAISQTGGHGDLRPSDVTESCFCSSYSGLISKVADGPDEVRKAVREELRQGATHIKLFVSGGVFSPSDPIWMNQFTEAEIRAAVYEAETHRTYVMAHCHTDEAVRRCVEYGVRTIEHGSVITQKTAQLMAQKGVFMVPTLSVVKVITNHADELGLPPTGLEKADGLWDTMLQSIAICSSAGVKIGLGSDLLGAQFHPLQGGELALRGQVSSPIDVLRSATSVNAEILRKQGELGCIAAGALADILVLDFDPFDDLAPFSNSESSILLLMKGGKIIRSKL